MTHKFSLVVAFVMQEEFMYSDLSMTSVALKLLAGFSRLNFLSIIDHLIHYLIFAQSCFLFLLSTFYHTRLHSYMFKKCEQFSRQIFSFLPFSPFHRSKDRRIFGEVLEGNQDTDTALVAGARSSRLGYWEADIWPQGG